MKQIKTRYILIILAVIIVGGFAWGRYMQSSDPGILAQQGIHWHPQLTIYVKGEKQEVPGGIGLAGGMAAMHTHESGGLVHVEPQGVVREADVALGKFFQIWGKDFNSFGSNVKMLVNGTENTELENYKMKDGDKIELYYE